MEKQPGRSLWSNRDVWRVAGLLWVWFVAGCEVAPTAIVVRVETDIIRASAMGPLQSIEIRAAFTPGGNIYAGTQDLMDPVVVLPGEVVLRASDAQEERAIEVVVVGSLGGGGTIERRFVVRFAPRRTTLLEAFLARRCTGVSCADEFTCGRSGECEPIDQPVLPDYRPLGGADGGAEGDTSVAVDAVALDDLAPDVPHLADTGVFACDADLQNDRAHCGACGRTCAAGEACQAGRCAARPANDTRAGATTIALGMPSVTLAADTTFASHESSGPCSCTAGHDVFFRFTLTAPELVYADTVGTPWNTALFLQRETGGDIAPGAGEVTCSDDMTDCGSPQSQVVAALDAGTYVLVLSGCGQGAAVVHFQHLPVGNGAVRHITPAATAITLSGVPRGVGRLQNPACCRGLAPADCSGGPEDTHWWVTCPSFAGTHLYASSCLGDGFGVLDQRSPSRAPLSMCDVSHVTGCGVFNFGSELDTAIPAGAGLHVLDVEGGFEPPFPVPRARYEVSLMLGTCPDGQPICADRCATGTAAVANCGSCGRACPSVVNASPTCSGGRCGFACESGLGNCDANASNGCEVNLNNSTANCGACARRCSGTTPRCVGGTCSA